MIWIFHNLICLSFALQVCPGCLIANCLYISPLCYVAKGFFWFYSIRYFMLISVCKVCITTLYHALTLYPQKDASLVDIYMVFLIPLKMSQACLLPAPKGTSCANYARCVNQILQGANNIQVRLCVQLLCLVYSSVLYSFMNVIFFDLVFIFCDFVMQLWLRIPLVKPDVDSMDAKSVTLVSKYVH